MFFSSSETTVFSIRKGRLQKRADEGSKAAGKLSLMLKQPNDLLTTILVGNELSNVTASAIATSILVVLFGSIGPHLAIVMMTLILLVFCEITPKVFAVQHSEKWAMLIARPLWFFFWLFYPLRRFATLIFTLIIGSKADIAGAEIISEERFRGMVKVAEDHGQLPSPKAEMIDKILRFGKLRALDLMIPRTRIFAVSLQDDLLLTLNLIKKSPYSRIPVYQPDLDHIIGILHIKDLILSNKEDLQLDLKKSIRKAFFVPEVTPLPDLLKFFKQNRAHFAIVVDEYGGTSGIVTLQDCFQQLFWVKTWKGGQGWSIRALQPGIFLVPAAILLNDFNEAFKTNFKSSGISSLGGFLCQKWGYIPKNEESMDVEGFRFTVKKASRKRIILLQVELLKNV